MYSEAFKCYTIISSCSGQPFCAFLNDVTTELYKIAVKPVSTARNASKGTQGGAVMTSPSHSAFSVHVEETKRQSTLELVRGNQFLLGRTTILSARQDSAQSVTIHAFTHISCIWQELRLLVPTWKRKGGKEEKRGERSRQGLNIQ